MHLTHFHLTVAQNAHDHKQCTLEPPVLSLRTLETYAPLRAEGSESVPAVVCAFCATSLAETSPSPYSLKAHIGICTIIITLLPQIGNSKRPPHLIHNSVCAENSYRIASA